MKMPIKVKYVDKEVSKISMPRQGDLGIDLYAAEDLTLSPGEVGLLSTGVCIEMPEGYALVLKDRSSVSKNAHVLAGVLDNQYRGIVKVRLLCVKQDGPFEIKKGDKIAQALIYPDLTSKFSIVEVDELTETVRGDGGFGSTGK